MLHSFAMRFKDLVVDLIFDALLGSVHGERNGDRKVLSGGCFIDVKGWW